MNRQKRRWEILEESKKSRKGSKSINEIVKQLLRNRGIKTVKQQKEFINPSLPSKIKLNDVGIKKNEVQKVISRFKKALKNKEQVIIYGDYDSDGICATAILWECLYSFGVDVLPYIPERFSEGYGLNAESVKKLKTKNLPAGRQGENLKLIITVDNGIVANKEVDEINKLGIDVIITDHHQKKKKLPKAWAIIHTDKISGAAIAWLIAKEIRNKFRAKSSKLIFGNGLDLAAIGTIADQIQLLGPNRSFAKYGLEALNKTERPGLLALFKEAGLAPRSSSLKNEVGPYEVGFIIAPRINATGRLEHGIDSLRLLCVKSRSRAQELAFHLARINKNRQRIVDEVVMHARSKLTKDSSNKLIILAHESYHEGVIGLAASKLVEEFYKPAIVIAKGKEFSKASARSVSGFNMIENLRKLEDLFNGGGHPMAAGFSLATKDIEIFAKKFQRIANPHLTKEILAKKLKIDLELHFSTLTEELFERLKLFEPTGLGNPTQTFVTKNVRIIDARVVGKDGNHLKLKLEESEVALDAIAFNLGNIFSKLSPDKNVDIVYSLEENIWNGYKNLQLKIKDIKFS